MRSVTSLGNSLQGLLARRWSVAVVFLTACFTLFPHLRFGSDVAAFFEDDFFYYLQIARNFAEHGRSTFDGVTPTNGYHPLWMIVLSLLWRCAGERRFFPALFCLLVLLSVAAGLAAWR